MGYPPTVSDVGSTLLFKALMASVNNPGIILGVPHSTYLCALQRTCQPGPGTGSGTGL